MLDRKYRFDHPGDTSRCVQVPDVRFHGTDSDRVVVGRIAKQSVDTLRFSCVANGGAGCVAFDQVNIMRRPACLFISGTHSPQLAF